MCGKAQLTTEISNQCERARRWPKMLLVETVAGLRCASTPSARIYGAPFVATYLVRHGRRPCAAPAAPAAASTAVGSGFVKSGHSRRSHALLCWERVASCVRGHPHRRAFGRSPTLEFGRPRSGRLWCDSKNTWPRIRPTSTGVCPTSANQGDVDRPRSNCGRCRPAPPELAQVLRYGPRR